MIAGKHLIMARAEHLTTCCEYYLEHEDEREAIAEAAYDFVRERFTQKDNCRAFLQQIRKRSRDGNATEQNLDFRIGERTSRLVSEPLPDALAKRSFAKAFSPPPSRRCAKISQTCFARAYRTGRKRQDLHRSNRNSPAHRHRLRYPTWVHRAIRGAEKIPGTSRKRFFSQSTTRVLIAARPRFRSSSRFTITAPTFRSA